MACQRGGNGLLLQAQVMDLSLCGMHVGVNAAAQKKGVTNCATTELASSFVTHQTGCSPWVLMPGALQITTMNTTYMASETMHTAALWCCRQCRLHRHVQVSAAAAGVHASQRMGVAVSSCFTNTPYNFSLQLKHHWVLSTQHAGAEHTHRRAWLCPP
jgi:hypothetical protein